MKLRSTSPHLFHYVRRTKTFWVYKADETLEAPAVVGSIYIRFDRVTSPPAFVEITIPK